VVPVRFRLTDFGATFARERGWSFDLRRASLGCAVCAVRGAETVSRVGGAFVRVWLSRQASKTPCYGE